MLNCFISYHCPSPLQKTQLCEHAGVIPLSLTLCISYLIFRCSHPHPHPKEMVPDLAQSTHLKETPGNIYALKNCV